MEPFKDRLADYPELIFFTTLGDGPLTKKVLEYYYSDYIETCHHYYDILPEEKMRDVSRLDYNPNVRPPTPDGMKLAPPPSKDEIPPIFILAFRRLLELQLMVSLK